MSRNQGCTFALTAMLLAGTAPAQRVAAAPRELRIVPAAEPRADAEREAEEEAVLNDAPEVRPGQGKTVTLDDRAPPDDGASVGMPPNTHLVRKGDTLWDICARYFHDPWRWPKIWALNPEIENPHWIFPGQVVRLDKEAPARAAVAAAAPGDEGAAGSPASPSPAVPPPAGLKQVGFIDEGGLRIAGTIAGSPEEKIMLSAGDAAYVAFDEKSRPVSGKEYPVYEVDADHPVRDPESRKTLGFLVHVRGYARVEASREKHPLVRATLTEASDPIERGFRVGELFRDRLNVAPSSARKALSGRLAANLSPTLLIGRDSFVVLNRGRAEGVEVGNVFRVVRRGDGYRDVMEHWEADDARYPALNVGEILALDVREHTTIGWVTRAASELRVGDAVALTAGE